MNDYIADILKGSAPGTTCPLVKSQFDEEFGMGRRLQLESPISIRDLISRWTAASGIKSLRLALAPKDSLSTLVKDIAICVGSGGSLLLNEKADVYFTGEMGHHEVLRAINAKKASVILTEHTNCERIYLRDRLRSELLCRLEKDPAADIENWEVVQSELDHDPITIITSL